MLAERIRDFCHARRNRMTTAIAPPQQLPRAAHDLGRIGFGFVVIYLIYFGSAFVFAALDPGLGALIRTLLTLFAVVGIETLWFKQSLGAAIRRLGFGLAPRRAFAAVLLAGAPLLAFFPIFSALTGTTFALPLGWMWTFLGYVAVSGIAEEVMFRAYLFGRLRAHRGFWRAGVLTLLCFSAVHVLLFLRVPVVVATAAIGLSAAVSLPMAYLFEHSRQSIWPVALLHSLAHSLSVVGAGAGALAPLAFMAVAAVAPWLVFVLVPRRFSRND
jgi:membrane protease YdiL (CAAX protease family)